MHLFITSIRDDHQPLIGLSPADTQQQPPRQPGAAAALLAGLLVLLCLCSILWVLGQDWNTEPNGQAGWPSAQTQSTLPQTGQTPTNVC